MAPSSENVPSSSGFIVAYAAFFSYRSTFETNSLIDDISDDHGSTLRGYNLGGEMESRSLQDLDYPMTLIPNFDHQHASWPDAFADNQQPISLNILPKDFLPSKSARGKIRDSMESADFNPFFRPVYVRPLPPPKPYVTRKAHGCECHCKEETSPLKPKLAVEHKPTSAYLTDEQTHRTMPVSTFTSTPTPQSAIISTSTVNQITTKGETSVIFVNSTYPELLPVNVKLTTYPATQKPNVTSNDVVTYHANAKEDANTEEGHTEQNSAAELGRNATQSPNRTLAVPLKFEEDDAISSGEVTEESLVGDDHYDATATPERSGKNIAETMSTVKLLDKTLEKPPKRRFASLLDLSLRRSSKRH